MSLEFDLDSEVDDIINEHIRPLLAKQLKSKFADMLKEGWVQAAWESEALYEENIDEFVKSVVGKSKNSEVYAIAFMLLKYLIDKKYIRIGAKVSSDVMETTVDDEFESIDTPRISLRISTDSDYRKNEHTIVEQEWDGDGMTLYVSDMVGKVALDSLREQLREKYLMLFKTSDLRLIAGWLKKVYDEYSTQEYLDQDGVAVLNRILDLSKK